MEHKLRYIGRPATASPATGFKTVHVREQQRLVSEAFA
jgi:2-oxoglutarate dehydrogenase E1 component